jgi:hypothetical protein
MTETVQLFAKTLELARIFGISKSTMMRLRKVEGFPEPAHEIPMGKNCIKLYSIKEFGEFLDRLRETRKNS